MHVKTGGLFYFADEPQYAGSESRAWIAHYLRACRNSHGNLGIKRYIVKRTGFGRYTVQLNASNSPIAVIITH
jgi:hypothetical protein